MKIKLPDNVNFIINKLLSAGYRADAVGGAVRDLIRGASPDDYDVTTNALPNEIKTVFHSCRTVDTGIKHGTVGVIINGACYEVTTYRVDGEYKDSRHPESVSFTDSLESDLARRDFTVNAIAYNEKDGITDPFGGMADIENKTIRAVGDPYKRFDEDALRILRAVRFSATLGFEIEKSTAKALTEKRDNLKNVSAERIFVELRKLFGGEYAYSVLNCYKTLFLSVVPELEDVELPDSIRFFNADWLTRLLSVFYLGRGDFSAFARRLKFDNYNRLRGEAVLSSVGTADLKNEIGINMALKELGAENTAALIDLEILLGNTTSKSREIFDKLLAEGTPYRVSDLEIDGKDIIELGARGKMVGVILDSLLDIVICRKTVNNKEKLLKLAEELVKKHSIK